MTACLTFGKYRDQDAAAVAASDPFYALWLLSQPWFKSQYPAQYSIVRRKVAEQLNEAIRDEDQRIARRHLPKSFRVVPAAEFALDPVA